MSRSEEGIRPDGKEQDLFGNEYRLTNHMDGIKILACIGPSPSSAKCLRWAAKIAEAFQAPWTALHVRSAENSALDHRQEETIRANMDLAEKLGARIVTLSGSDIAVVVAEYAKLSGITDLVIGKSRNKNRFKKLFKMDFEDRLVSLLPGIEVHVIPSYITRQPFRVGGKTFWGDSLQFSWWDTLKTAGVVGAATIVSQGLRAFNIGEQNMIMVYILAVLVISRITTGYAYGVIASVLNVLIFNFFFTVPYFTFNAVHKDYPITFVIMLLVALITSALTVRIKTQVRLAVERERRTEALYELNKKFLATRGLKSILTLTNEYIRELFNRSVVFYTEDPEKGVGGYLAVASADPEASFLRSEDEKVVAHWAFINKRPAGAGTNTLEGAKAFYLPVLSQDKVLGVLGVSSAKNPLNPNNRSFLRMIASQVAMALERQYLWDEQHRILVESEKEKMRSNLLRAISHDLRTPLTGILGASSAILENDESIDGLTRKKLISNIKEDAQWLIRMVENLLSVTRINKDTMNVTKAPEAVEEIVAESISRVRKRFPERKILVKVPDELLLVPMDGTLIAQVLINLLENAIKHSPDTTAIEVNVRKDDDSVIFEVLDDGEGIKKEEFPYLFENYVPNEKKSSDSSRGMGIGLSICMSIVKAHQGKMEAANRKTGGAVFRFTLPLEGCEQHGQ